jgi:hypothetical protein
LTENDNNNQPVKNTNNENQPIPVNNQNINNMSAEEIAPTQEDILIQKYNINPDPGLEVMTISWSGKKVIIESNKKDRVVYIEAKSNSNYDYAYRIYIKTINGNKVRLDDYPDNVCHEADFRPCIDPLVRPIGWTINDEKLIVMEDYAGSGAVPLYYTFLFDPVTKEMPDLATATAVFTVDNKYVTYTIHSDNTPYYCYNGPDEGLNDGNIIIKEVESNKVIFSQEVDYTEYKINRVTDQKVEFTANKIEEREEEPCVFATGETDTYVYNISTGQLIKK